LKKKIKTKNIENMSTVQARLIGNENKLRISKEGK